jgi:hypothetical protein
MLWLLLAILAIGIIIMYFKRPRGGKGRGSYPYWDTDFGTDTFGDIGDCLDVDAD